MYDNIFENKISRRCSFVVGIIGALWNKIISPIRDFKVTFFAGQVQLGEVAIKSWDPKKPQWNLGISNNALFGRCDRVIVSHSNTSQIVMLKWDAIIKDNIIGYGKGENAEACAAEALNYGFNEFDNYKPSDFQCGDLGLERSFIGFVVDNDNVLHGPAKYNNKPISGATYSVQDARGGKAWDVHIGFLNTEATGVVYKDVNILDNVRKGVWDEGGTHYIDLIPAQCLRSNTKKTIRCETYLGMIIADILVHSDVESLPSELSIMLKSTDNVFNTPSDDVPLYVSGNSLMNEYFEKLLLNFKKNSRFMTANHPALANLQSMRVQDEHVWYKHDGLDYDFYYGGSDEIGKNNWTCAIHAANMCGIMNLVHRHPDYAETFLQAPLGACAYYYTCMVDSPGAVLYDKESSTGKLSACTSGDFANKKVINFFDSDLKASTVSLLEFTRSDPATAVNGDYVVAHSEVANHYITGRKDGGLITVIYDSLGKYLPGYSYDNKVLAATSIYDLVPALLLGDKVSSDRVGTISSNYIINGVA